MEIKINNNNNNNNNNYTTTNNQLLELDKFALCEALKSILEICLCF